jgi:signal-transduction protein with cAMP-binding, CBS, and nucleotidyltransferase domain
MKTVKDILTKKPSHFNSVDCNDRVIDAIALMARENINYVIVEEQGLFKGILSEKDYVRKVILAGRESKNTKVGDIMSADIPLVDLEDSTDKCRELMNGFKIAFLPVFDNFDFVGVITLTDLLKETVDEQIRLVKGASTLGSEQKSDTKFQYGL